MINLQTNKDIKDMCINYFPFTSWHDQGLPECIGCQENISFLISLTACKDWTSQLHYHNGSTFVQCIINKTVSTHLLDLDLQHNRKKKSVFTIPHRIKFCII